VGLFDSNEPPSEPPSSRDAASRLIGQEVTGEERYVIKGIVAEGGWSVVYRGEQIRRGRPVAIKVMPAETMRAEEMRNRFEREVAIAKRLRHENIVAVTDNGQLPDGARFMVMELLEGETFDELLSRGIPPLARTLGIIEQVLAALGEAHKHNIVHRDIKPSNIFVETHKGRDHARIFDFGIALNEKAALKLTLPGTAFGTPGYISPEMARGDKSDGRADLYSLGVTLFEATVGRLPFDSQDAVELLKSHLMKQPPKPRELNPSVPEPLEAVIVKAMSKSAKDRYGDAAEMTAAIVEARRTIGPTAGRSRRRWFGW
jgi:serine/threonine-protein kinase